MDNVHNSKLPVMRWFSIQGDLAYERPCAAFATPQMGLSALCQPPLQKFSRCASCLSIPSVSYTGTLLFTVSQSNDHISLLRTFVSDSPAALGIVYCFLCDFEDSILSTCKRQCVTEQSWSRITLFWQILFAWFAAIGSLNISNFARVLYAHACFW